MTGPHADPGAGEAPAATYDRYRRALAGRTLPQAIVDLDRFDANATSVLERAGDRPVRVASKSVRCVGLLRRLRDRSPRFATLLCFTPTRRSTSLQPGSTTCSWPTPPSTRPTSVRWPPRSTTGTM